MRRWKLNFDDPELEAEFLRRDDEDQRVRRIVAAVMAFFFFGGFFVLDGFFTGGQADEVFPIRAAASAYMLVAGLVAAQRRFTPRVRQIVMYSAVLVSVYALDLMAVLVGFPLSALTGGHMLSTAAFFTLIGVAARDLPVMAGLILAGWGVGTVAEGGDYRLIVTNGIFITGTIAFGAVGAYMLEQLRRRTFLEGRSLAEERERSDRLLHNILPEEIATRLRQDPAAIADGADSVTVVFADVVGFTPMAADLPPTALVRLLDELFSEFDAVCREHGVEKIKTIGDAYMAVAGVPRADPDHALAATRVAAGFLEVADSFQGWPGHLELRVGLSSGPAVAGVIGRDKFAYDLWGDTVNTAARMESHGLPGQIQVSAETRRLLGTRYSFSEPQTTEIKGKGALTTYFLER